MRPRASSTDAQGNEDGWAAEPGYSGEMDPKGQTRIVVSVPPEKLRRTHEALLGVLRPPLGVLWRQVVDRRAPGKNGAPPKDHVGLDLAFERVLAALRGSAPAIYEDARGELWLRGAMSEQVVLDQDGLIYAYPDDPAFRDALDAIGIPERDAPTMAKRDYVKHWFHAEHDALEDRLVRELGLTVVAGRK